jgi:hypothetical protein
VAGVTHKFADRRTRSRSARNGAVLRSHRGNCWGRGPPAPVRPPLTTAPPWRSRSLRVVDRRARSSSKTGVTKRTGGLSRSRESDTEAAPTRHRATVLTLRMGQVRSSESGEPDLPASGQLSASGVRSKPPSLQFTSVSFGRPIADTDRVPAGATRRLSLRPGHRRGRENTDNCPQRGGRERSDPVW